MILFGLRGGEWGLNLMIFHNLERAVGASIPHRQNLLRNILKKKITFLVELKSVVN